MTCECRDLECWHHEDEACDYKPETTLYVIGTTGKVGLRLCLECRDAAMILTPGMFRSVDD